MNTQFPILLFVILIIAIILWPFLKRPMQTKTLLLWAAQNAEMRKKFACSATLMAATFVVSRYVSMPGINLSAPAVGIGLVPISVLKFGIGPFISACLLIQIVTVFIPMFRRWTFGGRADRMRLFMATIITTFAVTALQALFLSRSLEDSGFARYQGIVFNLMVVLTSVCSVAILVFAAKYFQRFLLGNGIALVAI